MEFYQPKPKSGQDSLENVPLSVYDPTKRESEINQRLQDMFNSIRKRNILQNNPSGDTEGSHKSSSLLGISFSRSSKIEKKKEVKDIITLQLEEIEDNVKSLEETAEQLIQEGSRSAPKYDNVSAHCSKLIKDLDDILICVSGREHLNKKRSDLHGKIGNLDEKVMRAKVSNVDCI